MLNNSPYNGYVFKFEISFPELNSPSKELVKQIFIKMNINNNEDVCISSIKQDVK